MNVHRRFVQISTQLALDIYAIAAYNYDIKNNHDFYGGREYEKLIALMLSILMVCSPCRLRIQAGQRKL